jgi:hypothetical protein
MSAAITDSFSSSPPSNPACGSPAPGSPTPSTGGVRPEPAKTDSPGGDDDSVEGDQAQACRRPIHLGEPPRATTLVSFGNEQRDPHDGVLPDLVEDPGRVPEPEERGPAAQEAVELRHDLFDGAARRARIVRNRMRSRACCTAFFEGQRARNAYPLAPRRGLERTSRWWKPRKSNPGWPSTSCTIGSSRAWAKGPAR